MWIREHFNRFYEFYVQRTLIVNALPEYTYNISTKEIKNLKLLNHLDTPYSHQNSFSKENEIPDTFTMIYSL